LGYFPITLYNCLLSTYPRTTHALKTTDTEEKVQASLTGTPVRQHGWSRYYCHPHKWIWRQWA